MSLKNIPISKSFRVKVGITVGDPSGIGPEIAAKAIPKLHNLADFTIIGDKWVFEKSSKFKIKNSKIKFIDLNNVNHKKFSFGKASAEY